MMNARERRAYLDRMRKDQAACLCPKCKRKTRHYTVPSRDEEALKRHFKVPNNGEDGLCDIVCEYCSETVKTQVSGLKPYTFVRIFE